MISINSTDGFLFDYAGRTGRSVSQIERQHSSQVHHETEDGRRRATVHAAVDRCSTLRFGIPRRTTPSNQLLFDRQRRLSNYKLLYREEPYELKFEAVVWMPSGIKDIRSPSHQITMSNVLVKYFISVLI